MEVVGWCLDNDLKVIINAHHEKWLESRPTYQYKELEIELADLKDKELKLRLDAERLQDPDYIARYAREKYLYSKDGEFIIKIPEE